MPQAFITYRNIPAAPDSDDKVLDKFWPTQALAAARAAAETDVHALTGKVEIGASVSPGRFVINTTTRQWRVLVPSDKTAAQQGQLLRRRSLILAQRVDRGLRSAWAIQAARFGVTALWAQSWAAFCYQQATAHVDGSVTALGIAQLTEVVEAAEQELRSADRIAWHFWAHTSAWGPAFAASPRRLQVAQADGGRANFGIGSGGPTFTVAAWSALSTVHYPAAMQAATSTAAPS